MASIFSAAMSFRAFSMRASTLDIGEWRDQVRHRLESRDGGRQGAGVQSVSAAAALRHDAWRQELRLRMTRETSVVRASLMPRIGLRSSP